MPTLQLSSRKVSLLSVLGSTQSVPHVTTKYSLEVADMSRDEEFGMMKNLLKCWALDESGQDLVEYALVVAVVALGAVASLRSLANTLNSVPYALIERFWAAASS